MALLLRPFILVFILPALVLAAPRNTPENRVVSVYVSQDFINELIFKFVRSDLVKELKIAMDPDHDQISLNGRVQIPVEELRAVNLDSNMGTYRFQVSVKPETTKEGHLILEFPLAQTFFYPANSTDPDEDRVIVPVQLLSVALASARGYLAALSGDFTIFDRHAARIAENIKGLEKAVAVEKDSATRDDLKTELESQRLQLQAIPIERKQLHGVAKNLEHILGFTGEKELNLNNELGARKNALVFKLKLSQLVPYLKDVELGGVRIIHDKKDGNGENFLAIDINSLVTAPLPPSRETSSLPRPGMKTAPSAILRLNQSLLESKTVVDAERAKMPSNIRNLEVAMRDDGIHVSGKYHTFIFFNIPFDTIVDFVGTATDAFEIRVREMKVAGINFEFLSKYVLETIKKRLENTLKGICTFEDVGVKEHARAMRVTVNPKALVPAFPELHLVDVDIRERELLLKIGRP